MENFKEDKVRLVGDCLTAASFLSYSGPFNYVLRNKMIFDHWKQDLIEKNIPNKEDFKLELFLSDEVEMSKWASESLPTDELSIQNGILTNNSSRWPLCIDPQMQAINWIKERERENLKNGKTIILSFNNEKYLKLLENAMRFGQTVIFEAIGTEIDPMIDPILEKNIVVEAGIEVVFLGDQKLDWSYDFKMIFTTKI